MVFARNEYEGELKHEIDQFTQETVEQSKRSN